MELLRAQPDSRRGFRSRVPLTPGLSSALLPMAVHGIGLGPACPHRGGESPPTTPSVDFDQTLLNSILSRLPQRRLCNSAQDQDVVRRSRARHYNTPIRPSVKPRAQEIVDQHQKTHRPNSLTPDKPKEAVGLLRRASNSLIVNVETLSCRRGNRWGGRFDRQIEAFASDEPVMQTHCGGLGLSHRQNHRRAARDHVAGRKDSIL